MGRTLALRPQEAAAQREAARLAGQRFSQGEGVYLEVLDAERADFASRRALAVARTQRRLAVVSIYKALGGGRQMCAQADQACGAAAGRAHAGIAQGLDLLIV